MVALFVFLAFPLLYYAKSFLTEATGRNVYSTDIFRFLCLVIILAVHVITVHGYLLKMESGSY